MKKKNGFHKYKNNAFGHHDLSEKIADKLTEYAGSWAFIILFFTVLTAWIIINVKLLLNPYDPYPFILLNLGLSMLAAIQAPVILMSQNRGAERDRRQAELDDKINRKAEAEITDMQKDLEQIKTLIKSLKKPVKKSSTKKK